MPLENMTVEEAAEYARVGPRKINEWIAKGMKHIRNGSPHGHRGPANITIRRSTLDAWLASQEVSLAEPSGVPGMQKKGRPRQKIAGRSGKDFLS
jgi:excisionase family DNA binding protein